MKTLMFIDTNILLDFYRTRGEEKGLSILKHVDESHDRIITTSQVEMEFKRNRQVVLLDALKGLKKPDWNSLTPPTLLREANPTKTIQTAQKRIDVAQRKMRERLVRWLENPTQHDAVYQCVQRLFKSDTPANLTIAKKERHSIRRAALKRFLMGYPPRKTSDTSYGDAINWEWIVRCAKEQDAGVVIVSRDSDYGISHDKKSVLNDWLKQEFKERVSKKRKILLTSKLTQALKEVGVAVSAKEVQDEEKLVESLAAQKSAVKGLKQQIPFHAVSLSFRDFAEDELSEDWEPEVDDIGD